MLQITLGKGYNCCILYTFLCNLLELFKFISK